MLTLSLQITATLLVLGTLGFLYAYLIYLKPWEKTYWEVVAGVGAKDLAESALIGLTLWHFELFWQLGPGFPGWLMLFFPWACSGVSGLSQIYWQEKKHKEGHKQAKWTVAKYNNKHPKEE